MWAVFLVVVFALVAGGDTRGTEPDGYLSFRPLRIENGNGGEPGDDLVIRLDVRSLVVLRNSRLTLTVPTAVASRVLTASWEDRFRQVSGPDGVRILEADLESFDPGRPVVVRFEFTPPEGAGGIVSFTVDGTTDAGKVIREAIGISIGHPGRPGVHRHGAVEYPAVSVPEATR